MLKQTQLIQARCLKNFSEGKGKKMKSKLIVITDLLILLFLVLILIFLVINGHYSLRIISIAISLMAWMVYLVKKYYKRKYRSKIKTIQLLNEREEVVKEWYIRDEQGLLIGKNFQSQLVDIDLTDADYAVLIEKQHAVLNCVDGKWHLEDLGSRNGTGVKAVEASQVKRLEDEEVVLVHPGDRIYIAKSILQLVK